MAEIDGLLANMVRRGAERVLMESDQPMRVFSPSGEVQGALIAGARLQSLVREILPAELRPRLLQDGRYQFAHETPEGSFQVRVARREGQMQVEVLLKPAGKAEPAPQPAAAASATGRDRAPRPLPAPQGHSKGVLQVALSPGGEALASAGEDGAIYLWSIEQSKRLHTLRQPSPGSQAVGSQLKSQSAQAFCVAFSPEGSQLAGGVAGALQTWDARTGAARLKVSTPNQNALCVAFGPEGALAVGTGASASGPPGAEGKVEVWDGPRKKVARTYAPRPWALAAAFSADGRWLAIGDGAGVGLCDLKSRPGALSSLQSSLGRGGKVASFTYAIALGAPVVSLSFSTRGSALALCAGGQCALLDATTQRVLWKQRQQGMRAVAFAPDGTTIAAASQDGQIYFFDWASGAPARAPLAAADAQAAAVSTLAFSADGRLLACGGSDGTLRAWQMF